MSLPDVAGITVTCTWTARPGDDADLSALLLTGGRVRGDHDFVFYNQPVSTDRSVRYDTDRVAVDLRALDAAIEAVAVVVSRDAGRTLAELGPVHATVTGPDGAPLAWFRMDTTGPETAAVAMEIYRRDRRWKVRAVGQGYADGLAGLARDFGVDVADAGPAIDRVGDAHVDRVGDAHVDWRNPPVPAGYEL